MRSRCPEVLAAHSPEIRIVEDQIAELRALLDEVHLRKAFTLSSKL